MSFYKIITNNKGALFGMDARIAMAIFASISIIMGYFSFGKINMAKDSALISELEAITSAMQNYQTDMGTFYQFTINTVDGFNGFEALYNINAVNTGYQKNWNGPYYTITSNSHHAYGDFSISYSQADRTACTSSSDCYAWIELTGIKQVMWDRINSFVDEGLGNTPEPNGQQTTTGKIRANATTDPRTLYYRSIKRKK